MADVQMNQFRQAKVARRQNRYAQEKSGKVDRSEDGLSLMAPNDDASFVQKLTPEIVTDRCLCAGSGQFVLLRIDSLD